MLITPEINKIENGKTIDTQININESQSWFFEKMSRINQLDLQKREDANN